MWLRLLWLCALLSCARAHGRVIAPPSRASAWRFGFDTAPNYDDDGLNCGGFAVQWSLNGGRCGICGDPYQVAPPRPHELGGAYGQGVIVGKYLSGSLLTTTVDLTTSHRGFWEFKLCPDPESNEQSCFDKHILELEDGGTKYYPTQGSQKYTVNYRLPKGMICDHCVLQWRYTAGNNWGDCKNGTQALGCGHQEQFGACSDISIGVTKSLPLKDETSENEIPYPLFYYLKHGYFDTEQGNRRQPSPPQQLVTSNQKKPQTHKKKPKPNPHISFNQQPSNSHQNHKTIQKPKQPTHKRKQPESYKKPYYNIISPFEKYAQQLEIDSSEEKDTESFEKFTQPYEKHSQPSEKYKQPYYQKFKTPATELSVWQPHHQTGFSDNQFHTSLQPAFFEFDRKKPTHQKLTHRKPRLKHKGPKKKSKWGKLFYGFWR